MRYDQMPKAYLIMLEMEGRNAGTNKVPLFNHGWETREQAEAQVEKSAADFERWRMSIKAFPIVPKEAG